MLVRQLHLHGERLQRGEKPTDHHCTNCKGAMHYVGVFLDLSQDLDTMGGSLRAAGPSISTLARVWFRSSAPLMPPLPLSLNGGD